MPNSKDKPDTPEQWHLDKKVPIAIIIAIIVQTFAIGVYVSKQDSRIETLERDAAKMESRVKDGEVISRDSTNRLIRVEEKSSTILELVRQLADRDRASRQP